MDRLTLHLPVSLPAALAVLACVYYLVATFRTYRRLAHIPGPRLAGVSYLPTLRRNAAGRLGAALTGLTARYGPLVRTGPNEVLTSDPELLRRMSTSTARSGGELRRSSWYNILTLNPDLTTLFDARDNSVHDAFKAQMAPGYAGRDNDGLERDIDAQLDAVATLLRRRIGRARDEGTTAAVDLTRLADYFALDTLGLLAYGRDFGCLREDGDVIGYRDATAKIVPLLTVAADVPWIGDWLFNYWGVKLLGPRASDADGMGRLLKIAKEIVAERFEGGKGDGRRDMLGSFLRHGIDREQAEAQIPHQILAGAETTATTIRSTLYHVLTTPGVYDRLVEEITAAARDGRISAHVTLKEAKTLPYLQAVIWEGLRYTPPFLGTLLKEVPAGGFVYRGVQLPAGTRVGHNTMGAMRDPAVFGEDAAAFRPARWLEAEPDRRAAMARTVDVVFGAGRWACAGRPLALAELDKFFVQLLRRFDLRMNRDEGRPAFRCRSYNLWLMSDMWVDVAERDE